jgi:hypothetical protein
MLRYRIQIRIGRDGLCENIKSISITYCGVSTKYHRERIVIQEFVTAPSLRPVLSIASICELESMDNNHCAICFGIAKLKLTTDRERDIIFQYNNPSCLRRCPPEDYSYKWSGDARWYTPDSISLLIWQRDVVCQYWYFANSIRFRTMTRLLPCTSRCDRQYHGDLRAWRWYVWRRHRNWKRILVGAGFHSKYQKAANLENWDPSFPIWSWFRLSLCD